jgi:hypothetical protein
MRSKLVSVLVLSLAAFAGAAHAAQAVSTDCRSAGPRGGVAADVAAAIGKFTPMLSNAQRALLERPFNREAAIRWSNLPIGIVPRGGLRLGDLDAGQAAAARRVFEAALSACGLALLDEVRLADDWLIPYDKRPIGWGGGNYYLTVLNTPSATSPWMLQIGGHHLAYNFTFNGRAAGATPMFFGTEPIRFEMKGVQHQPLTVQSTAMSQLATAIATHAEAKLSGTFTDVVKGVVVSGPPGPDMKGGTDTGFPHTYPTGDVDRGVRVGALSADQQQVVRAAIESYTSLPGAAVSAALREAYEDPAAFRDTFVGYSGSTDLSTRGSYVRIDGPRIWMEFVVQPAVAHPDQLHYHALWRDKLSDYGGEAGP